MADEDEKDPFTGPYRTPEHPALGGRAPTEITVFSPMRESNPPLPSDDPFRPRPPAEMRSYERSWGQRMGDVATDAMSALGANRYVSQDLGKGLANAATMIPPVGMVVGGHDAAYHGAKGEWWDAGLNALSMIPGGKYAGEALQAGRVARGASQAPPPPKPGEALGVQRDMPPVPSTQAHWDEGDRGFKEFRDLTNIKFNSAPVTQWTDNLLADLKQGGHYRTVDSDKALFNAVDILREKAAKQSHLTALDFDEFRNALIRIKKTPGSAAEGAMEAQSRLFDYLERTGNPTLQKAVGNWKYAEKGDIIDTVLEKADISPGTKGIDTQSRVALNAKATERWTDAEREVLKQARKGPPAAQIVDKVADFLTGRQGGLGGVASTVPVTTWGINKYGPILGAIPGVSSFVSGTLSPALKRTAVQEAGHTIRSGSPMYQDILSAQPQPYKHKLDWNAGPRTSTPGADLVRRQAIVEALKEAERRKEQQEGYR